MKDIKPASGSSNRFMRFSRREFIKSAFGAGVALGFDRALMVCSGATSIKDVMSFTTERA